MAVNYRIEHDVTICPGIFVFINPGNQILLKGFRLYSHIDRGQWWRLSWTSGQQQAATRPVVSFLASGHTRGEPAWT